MNVELTPVRTAHRIIAVAMLTIAVSLPAAGQGETIDATARGTWVFPSPRFRSSRRQQ